MKENRNPKCACSCVCVCVCVCVWKRQREGEKWACIKFHIGLLFYTFQSSFSFIEYIPPFVSPQPSFSLFFPISPSTTDTKEGLGEDTWVAKGPGKQTSNTNFLIPDSNFLSTPGMFSWRTEIAEILLFFNALCSHIAKSQVELLLGLRLTDRNGCNIK